MYEVGEFVYVEGLEGIYPIERIFEVYFKKVEIIIQIGDFSLYTKDVRKATLNEIKKYKLENMFKNK